MKNRFEIKKNAPSIRQIMLPITLFAVIGGLFYAGLGSVGRVTQEEQLRSVQQAITRATIQCYAVEGQYPPSLGYLEQNYGLMLDRQKYIIQYDIFAQNIMPTILVLPVDFEGNGGDF